jgi:carboxylate-amine ligase
VRYLKMRERFGITAAEQLSNGFHVHVGIESREEGVGILDRIRVWSPVLLALSANSPFWQGSDTGYASYRHQVWSRWPTTGPTDLFGSAEAYEHHRAALLSTQVPLDAGMLYFDARLCEHHPTVEVRVADVCLDAIHVSVIATIIRALVETAARAWTKGEPAAPVPASLIRTWFWQASQCGIEAKLIDPAAGAPAPAGDVVARLLETIGPVLAEYGELSAVETVITQILREGTGARRQRNAYATRGVLADVVADALDATHQLSTVPAPLLPAAPAKPRPNAASPQVSEALHAG